MIYNVTEDQVNEAVELVFDTLQLHPDMASDFHTFLIKWLDEKGIEVID